MPNELVKHENAINEFVKDQKELINYLRAFKATIKTIVPIKEQEQNYYKSFALFLSKYEENN